MNDRTHKARPDYPHLRTTWMEFFIERAFKLLDEEQQERIVDAVGDELDEVFHPQIEEGYDKHVAWCEKNLGKFVENKIKKEQRDARLTEHLGGVDGDEKEDEVTEWFRRLWHDGDGAKRMHLSDMLHLFNDRNKGWTPLPQDEQVTS